MYSYTITKHNKSNTITSLHRRYTLPSYVSASTLRGLVFTLTLVRRRRALSGAFRDVTVALGILTSSTTSLVCTVHSAV